MQRTLAGSRHQTFTIIIIFSNVLSRDFSEAHSKEGSLTRKPQAAPWAFPFSHPVSLLFTNEEPVSIRNSSEHSALHNTQGVVTLHFALHLQAKYNHTQVSQKPSGAVSNHKTSMSACSRIELAKAFLHSYKSQEATIEIMMYITKSFHLHSRSFSDLCCHHTMSN